MNRLSRFALVLLLGSALGSAPLLAQPADPAPVAADTPSKMPSGATFTLASGWSARVSGPMTVMSPPETDLKLAFVEVKAADGSAAAAAAWEIYKPGGARPVRLASPLPGRDGWDETTFIQYEVSPNEHLSLSALARRKGETWTVSILDGNVGTLEKRGAAVQQIVGSLRPDGFARESFAGKTAHPLDAARVAQLLDFVRESAGALDVPGVGIALYSGGRIVYEGGVGVRERGKPEPVDAHTRFMIASNTKSMATLLLAELVSQGKLSWDDPVTKVYPTFRLGDEATTRSTLIRHLVCACTGLPRKDLEWVFRTTPATPATVTFEQLATTQPTSKFGETFQYNNLMAAAAGYIAGHLYYPDMEIGAAFDRAAEEHVFDPLGMKDSTFSTDDALKANHASPHGEILDGTTQVLSMDFSRLVRPYRPAGGAWSSPHDMILYMKNELDEGRLPNGRQLLSKEALLARRARGAPIGEDAWYGMGLIETVSGGVSIISHGGDLSGFHSDMILIPSAGVAAVILTNSDSGTILRGAFQRRLFEILYDGKPEAAEAIATAIKQRPIARAAFRSTLTVPPDPEVLDGLAASYRNPDLGTLRIERKDGVARLHAAPWSTTLVTRKNPDGTVSLVAVDPGGIQGLALVVGSEGGKRTLTLRDAQHVYIFTEI